MTDPKTKPMTNPKTKPMTNATIKKINAMIRDSAGLKATKGRLLRRFTLGVLACACAGMAVLPALAQRERPALNITGYVIDAELDTDDPPPYGHHRGQLYRARQSRRGQLRLSSRAQSHQDHR